MNRHEKLLGRYKFSKDITFVILQTLQFLMSICLCWTVIFVFSGFVTISNLKDEVNKRPEVYSLTLILIIQLAFVVICTTISMSGMPATIRSYTLTTSLEMMKKRDIIENVLQKQKTEKNQRSYRVF